MRKGKIQGQFEILIENLEALSFVLYYINDQPPTSAIRFCTRHDWQKMPARVT